MFVESGTPAVEGILIVVLGDGLISNDHALQRNQLHCHLHRVLVESWQLDCRRTLLLRHNLGMIEEPADVVGARAWSRRLSFAEAWRATPEANIPPSPSSIHLRHGLSRHDAGAASNSTARTSAESRRTAEGCRKQRLQVSRAQQPMANSACALVLVKAFILCHNNKEAILFTIDPYYGNLN